MELFNLIFDSILFSTIWSIVVCICTIFLFKKMGVNPWAAIVPLWYQYSLFSKAFNLGAVGVIICVILSLFLPGAGNLFLSVAYFVIFRNFGKNTLFSVLGAMCAPIGIMICAFDDSTYNG